MRAGVQVSISNTSPWRTLGGWPSAQEMVTMVTNSPFWEWKHPHTPTTATDVVWPAHDGHKPAVHHWRPVQIPDLSRTLCSPGKGNTAKMFGTWSWRLAARSCTSVLPVTLCDTRQVPHLCNSISSNGDSDDVDNLPTGSPNRVINARETFRHRGCAARHPPLHAAVSSFTPMSCRNRSVDSSWGQGRGRGLSLNEKKREKSGVVTQASNPRIQEKRQEDSSRLASAPPG